MKLAALVLVLAGCGAPVAPTPTPPPAPGQLDARCQAVRPHVEQLYRAEAQQREPKRVDAAVADNTTMVMNDCAQAPAKVADCARGVDSSQDLEARCLLAIDDEGSEGDRAR